MRRLYEQAASLPSDDWRGFLAAQAPDDPELAREILGMLALRSDGETPTVPGAHGETSPAAGGEHPSHIGCYRIVRVLGEGGMGTVYEAIESAEIERPVALKLIKLGMQSVDVVQRFERERQALAMMDHVGIAKVHTCGTTATGQPFFVMELVRGVPLALYCERSRLSLRKRLRVVRQLCAAVHHAHQKGVVHRDLKPGNVLVSDQDGVLQVKVIDFGLAKSIAGSLPRGDYRTGSLSWVAGTLVYMAPEQAISSTDTDTRADIYSIGVILYELLVGSLPLTYEQLTRDGIAGFATVLREVDPPRPSARLESEGPAAAAAIAASRRVSLDVLRKSLRRDLDWIVLTALEKDRERRYASAAELAADLQRFLNDEPVLVGPPTARYRLGKFARRHRGKLIAATLLLASVLTGGVIAASYAVGYYRTVHEYDMLDGVVSMERIRDGIDEASIELPGNEPVIAAWIEDADTLARRQAEFVASRDQVAAKSGSAPAGGGAMVFTSDAQGYLHGQLAALATATDELRTKSIPLARARQRWLQHVRAATFAQREGSPSWADVRRSLAGEDSEYAGKDVAFEDDDVVGLVPIGLNDQTGLWEFYHLRSAWDGTEEPMAIRVPRHGDRGTIEVAEGTGIVFVLLPGGRTWVGVDDPLPDELRPHRAELRPFLLARHELTRGQWRRLGGIAAHWHRGDGDLGTGEVLGDRHAAESIDWEEATQVLARHGLQLPTESQWEYGCRAGTSTPWWTGKTPATTSMRENLLDPRAVARHAAWSGDPEGHEDAFVRLARVGAGEPNGFGLYDMHGNVKEWCRDVSSGDAGRPRKGDGLRILPSAVDDFRVVRGGSFVEAPSRARSSARAHFPTDVDVQDHGVRAARPLRRSDY